MSSPTQLRTQLRTWVPWWLSDRFFSSGKTVGFRFLWAMIKALDLIAEWIVQGLQAAWPGKGTPTALELIGRSRVIQRGHNDTDDQYAAKLITWLDRWRSAGTQFALAREIHEFLATRPKVRVINRAGHWVTMDTDGTVTTNDVAWDWDSVSNPERAGYWSELFVIVYYDYTHSGTWGDGRLWGARDSGIGHVVTREERSALLHLLSIWKSAHSKVRVVIWTTDATLFDPLTPASCPDGTWGQWSIPGTDPRVPGGRVRTTCRYWESE